MCFIDISKYIAFTILLLDCVNPSHIHPVDRVVLCNKIAYIIISVAVIIYASMCISMTMIGAYKACQIHLTQNVKITKVHVL